MIYTSMTHKLSAITIVTLLTLTMFLSAVNLTSDSVSAQIVWIIETVDSTGDVGYWTSIALDSNNYPHVSYYDDTSDDLKYAKWTGSTWIIETVDSTGDVGDYTSIALDDNNYPHISYCGNSDLKYAKWTDGVWNIETVDSAGYVGKYTSIALDSNSYPHISYQDYGNEDLKYARYDGSDWSIETADNLWDVGKYTSLVLDSRNHPHISYCADLNWHEWTSTEWDLKYAEWTGSEWNIETIDSDGGVGKYTSIAVDSSDYPHISYCDWGNDYLKYAKWTGSTWIIETVDSTGDVGDYTSIALDDNNYPHISYRDWRENCLKYAKWTGSTWSIEIVDSARNVGHFTSIALDNSNYPHISYYDDNKEDLKYAKLIPAADLTFSPSGIVFSKPEIVSGDTVTISALIHNLGLVDASNVVVNFYDDTNLIGVDTIDLIAGDTATASVQWIAPYDEDNHIITVKIDELQSVIEVSEADNNLRTTIYVDDGDGYIGSTDAFPNNPKEWMDTDKDGVGDNSDFLVNFNNNVFYGILIGVLIICLIIIALFKKKKIEEEKAYSAAMNEVSVLESKIKEMKEKSIDTTEEEKISKQAKDMIGRGGR